MATLNHAGAFRPQLAVRSHSDNLPVYLAALLTYILLLPPQLNVSVLGSVLPPYRFFLIPAALYIAARGLRGGLKINWCDILIVLATAWIWLALYMTSKPIDWFTASFAQTVDILLAYLFARVSFRNLNDLRVYLVLIAPALAIVGAIMALESITKIHILQSAFALAVGGGSDFLVDTRLGLMRARGPFPHPIGAGIFLASFLPLYWLSGIRGWPKVIGLFASACAFFSVSSAAFLALSATILLLGYNWITTRFSNLTWRLFLSLGAFGVLALELGTQSGTFNFLMRYGSLNAISAYNRVLIWRYGSQNVEKNPWFGIGYEDWERPVWMISSIDHYWLLLAIQFGFLVPFMIAIAMFIAILALVKKSTQSTPADKQAERGVAISMTVFALGVVSVALWLSPQVWFFMLFGICVSLSAASPSGTPAPKYSELAHNLSVRSQQHSVTFIGAR